MRDNCDERAWAARCFHDFPDSVSSDSIEGLGHINGGRVKATMLFHTFLPELPGGKDHVGGPSTFAEATLTLREETLHQVI